MNRNPRRFDDKHLDFIRSLPCLVCGNNIETQAAHIRFSEPKAAKDNPGVGQKPHDLWCLPLCGEHHTEQHKGNERRFWALYGIDPIYTAMALYVHSGDHERGLQIIENAKQREFA